MLAKFLKIRFDLIFSYIFIFLIPLEKKHVFQSLSQFPGYFINWQAIQIYLTDIVFCLVLLFWLFQFLFRIKTEKNLQRINLKIWIILGLFLLIAIIPPLSGEFVKLEAFHLTKLIEYFLIFAYIISNFDTIGKILLSIVVFTSSACLQALLGIFQFFAQHSFNLKIFAEVDLSPHLQNVAKIVVDGEKLIRAYGTFPHSNVLGGFLFVAIVFVLIFSLLAIQFFGLNKGKSPKMTSDSKLNNPNGFLSMFHVEHFGIFGLNKGKNRSLLAILILILTVLLTSFLFTFSRTAWLALGIVVIFLIVLNFQLLISFFKKNIWENSLIFGLFLVFIGILIITFWPEITSHAVQFDQFGDKALTGRVEYAKIALKMAKKSPIFGLGYGNFTNKLAEFSTGQLKWWQIQPVHNVFLLILAENGILGLLIFIFFLGFLLFKAWRICKNLDKENIVEKTVLVGLTGILIGFFIIMLFDHYLWTIQQGALTFWLILGLLTAAENFFKKEKI